MADETIHDQALVTSAASDDEVGLWVVASGVLRRITKQNLIGATLTGLGTIVTNGYTLTVPATGTAALLNVAQTYTARPTFANDILTSRMRGINSGGVERGLIGAIIGPLTVGTTAVAFTIGTRASLLLVYGKDVSSAIYFIDIVSFLSFGVTAVNNTLTLGGPPARTYTVSGNNLMISIASGTMNIQTLTLGMLYDP